MRIFKRAVVLIGLLMTLALCGVQAVAQLATTAIGDTVYRADGTPAGGSVLISWNAFTSAAGAAVAAGNTSVTLGSVGALSVSLAPNSGGTPMGTYYTAVFHLNDGTTMRQFWSVPAVMAGAAPVKLAAISSTVLPSSVAMQTVSKQYVDNAIASAEAGTPFDSSPYVSKAGDTMTGPLQLPGDPVSSNQAADMHYVDSNVAAIAAGLGTKVSTVPGATQVVSQPAGTQLQVNNLNGELYASQYETGGGGNGVANALASGDCASGCSIKVEPTDAATSPASGSELVAKTQVIDERGGARTQTTLDPLPVGTNGTVAAMNVNNTSTRTAAQLSTLLGGGTLASYAQTLSNNALGGGNNQFPESSGSGIPYFKSTYGVQLLTGNYNSEGQKVQFGNIENCYGIGDCISGAQYITSYGGLRDSSDEGVHPWELLVSEAGSTFTGTCVSGCTTGSTQVAISAVTDQGKQGEGRFLIDTNPAKDITTGQIISSGGTGPPLSFVNFSGTSFPTSVFFQLAAIAPAQPHNMAPGTITLPISTSGVPTGYATNTVVVPTSGVACLAEAGITNFEIARYTVVDGTHLQLTLNKVHSYGATVAIGGMCGYGLEETVDTIGAVRQVFPVLGSTSATQLSYVGFTVTILGRKDLTGGYLNDTFSIASVARSGNVVTATLSAPIDEDVNGLTMTVSGVADSSYNGSYVVTTTSSTTLTYANTGANSTSSGGTVGITTGNFVLYPMAEVLGVTNPATKQVDGTLTLGANNAPWAAGDTVEQPHYYLNRVAADVEFITQYEPRPLARQSAGKTYAGRVGPQLYGWEINNAANPSDYYGSGGTHQPPAAAYSVLGEWANDMEMQAGDVGVMRVHCGARGCNRWDTSYAFAQLDAQSGVDTINFSPRSSTLTNVMGGTSYSFSPTAFTAPTINVGTLNATTITGGISGSSITSGTVPAARLPIFGPSGTTHAPGAVPDPGATAGSTRYLREDGTWQVPPGGGGGGSLSGGAAYTIPYQSAANVTAMLTSPTVNGTYFLTEAPSAGAAVAPTWTNATSYLASPPAIGGTTPAAINGTTGTYSGAVTAPSVTGGIFTTTTGTVSAVSGTTATILTLPTLSSGINTYMVTCGLPVGADAGDFGATAIAYIGATTSANGIHIINNAAFLNITLDVQALQVKQTSGSTVNVQCNALRIL